MRGTHRLSVPPEGLEGGDLSGIDVEPRERPVSFRRRAVLRQPDVAVDVGNYVVESDRAVHARSGTVGPVAPVVPRQLVGPFTDGDVELGDHDTRGVASRTRQQ